MTPVQGPMTISDAGLKLLEAREGTRLKAYRDSRGIWTIGVGHTAAAGPPEPHEGLVITPEECDAILRRDLADVIAAVNRACEHPPTQDEFDAMCSFAFNIGVRGFENSTTLREFNAMRLSAAADAFMLWNRPPEILSRRRAERLQFLSAAHVARA